MRAVYRLLGLVRRYGPDPVEQACDRALQLDVVSVTKIASMLERATEHTTPVLPTTAGAATARFARQATEFASRTTSPAMSLTALASVGTSPATEGTALASEGTSTLTLIAGAVLLDTATDTASQDTAHDADLLTTPEQEHTP